MVHRGCSSECVRLGRKENLQVRRRDGHSSSLRKIYRAACNEVARMVSGATGDVVAESRRGAKMQGSVYLANRRHNSSHPATGIAGPPSNLWLETKTTLYAMACSSPGTRWHRSAKS